jgi:hypothetical protein
MKKETFITTDLPSKVEVTIGINDDDYGWFEFLDIKSGGNGWHAEGGLWFEGTTLVDYDGVFELPEFILDKLESWGYNVDEIR